MAFRRPKAGALCSVQTLYRVLCKLAGKLPARQQAQYATTVNQKGLEKSNYESHPPTARKPIEINVRTPDSGTYKQVMKTNLALKINRLSKGK